MTDEIQAWETEDAAIVIFGTHDPDEARVALRKFYAGCGFEIGDDEWPEDEPNADFYTSMQNLWTDATGGEDDGMFETFTEAGPHRTPFMIYFQ